MLTKLACAVGAGLLLSASFGVAGSRDGLVPGATNELAIALIEVARRHSSSSSSSSSASARSSGSRASGSSGSGGRRWSGGPSHRSHVVAPFRTNVAPYGAYATPYVARPRGRFARRLVPLATLSTIYIGNRYYYPYRYMPYDGPVCTGVTENGCELQWLEVPTESGGDTAWQCVEFCPQE